MDSESSGSRSSLCWYHSSVFWLRRFSFYCLSPCNLEYPQVPTNVQEKCTGDGLRWTCIPCKNNQHTWTLYNSGKNVLLDHHGRHDKGKKKALTCDKLLFLFHLNQFPIMKFNRKVALLASSETMNWTIRTGYCKENIFPEKAFLFL